MSDDGERKMDGSDMTTFCDACGGMGHEPTEVKKFDPISRRWLCQGCRTAVQDARDEANVSGQGICVDPDRIDA